MFPRRTTRSARDIVPYMIYLIGGSPRCGKTKVAKSLAEKTHMPWFPADYLSAVVYSYIPENERALKFPLKDVRNQNPTNDFLYSSYSPEEIVGFYHTQAESVWSGLEAFISYAAHDEQDFIIEGYQITPELVSRLDEDTKKNIRIVFLYKEDEADIEVGIKKNVDPGDWLLKNTKNEAILGKVAKMIHLFGDGTRGEAERLKMPVFNMDGEFEKKVEVVTSQLLS